MSKYKGKTLISLTAPELMPLYAEIMELYYTGDKIGYRALAKQLGIGENIAAFAIDKYIPVCGDRDVVLLLQSKINDMWGPEDLIPDEEKQEDPEE